MSLAASQAGYLDNRLAIKVSYSINYLDITRNIAVTDSLVECKSRSDFSIQPLWQSLLQIMRIVHENQMLSGKVIQLIFSCIIDRYYHGHAWIRTVCDALMRICASVYLLAITFYYLVDYILCRNFFNFN